jgi:hypothetical protein
MMNKSLLSKQKFGICVIAVSLCSLIGCASPYREKVYSNDMSNFFPDCRIRNQQVAFLKTLKAGRSEMQTAQMELALFGPFTTDPHYKTQLANGDLNYHIQRAIERVEIICPIREK